MTDPVHLTLRATLPSPKDLPAPEPANFFSFAFSGLDIQMLVGYIDPLAVLAIQQAGGKGDLSPLITHRFAVSQTGFALLRAQLDEILKKFEAQEQKQRDATGG